MLKSPYPRASCLLSHGEINHGRELPRQFALTLARIAARGGGPSASLRVQAGPDLEWRLAREVALLSIDHGAGFAVRLHVLGDFYSVAYVTLWRTLLDTSPQAPWGHAGH